jgi:hypothetical protein
MRMSDVTRMNRSMDTVVGTTYSASEERAIDRMTTAIFAERCPGERWSEGDRPQYRAAAIAALRELRILKD